MNARIDQLRKVLIIRHRTVREKHSATDLIADLHDVRKAALRL